MAAAVTLVTVMVVVMPSGEAAGQASLPVRRRKVFLYFFVSILRAGNDDLVRDGAHSFPGWRKWPVTPRHSASLARRCALNYNLTSPFCCPGWGRLSMCLICVSDAL